MFLYKNRKGFSSSAIIARKKLFQVLPLKLLNSEMKIVAGVLVLIGFWLGNLVEAATVFFPLTLTWQNTSVAGNVRPVIHSNFQFPGPELRINKGDNVQFAVTNLCPFSVTVHFHGMVLDC